MGRPKQFDREELLRKATDVFLHHGFSATSTQQLVEALGVNRKSMYAEFGSKQGIFEAVLAHYNEATIGANFGPLETETAGLAEVEQVILLFAGAARGRGFGLGCLLCNTAVERAANDVATLPFVERYFDRMTSAFQNALENARRDGGVSLDLDVISEARFFTSLVLGLAVFVRGKADPDMADGASRIALAHLTSLAVERVKVNE